MSFGSCDTDRQVIVKRVFEEPVGLAQKMISSHMARFGEKNFLQKMDKLSDIFLSLKKSLVHGNFTTNNVVIKDIDRCSKIVVSSS